jgi:hypothetical protein
MNKVIQLVRAATDGWLMAAAGAQHSSKN